MAKSPIETGRRPGHSSFATSFPIPRIPNYVYAGGWYGTVLRYDKTTGQIVHLLVRNSRYRTAQMAPIAFSPQDPHTLYAAAQYLLKSNDGGFSWQEVSPDLAQKTEADKKKLDPRTSCDYHAGAVAGESWRDLGRHWQRPGSSHEGRQDLAERDHSRLA